MQCFSTFFTYGPLFHYFSLMDTHFHLYGKKLNFIIKKGRGLVDKIPKGYAFMEEREHIVVVVAWN